MILNNRDVRVHIAQNRDQGRACVNTVMTLAISVLL
jgi:hypothetical protein